LATSNTLRAHLDHLIRRQSIRYVPAKPDELSHQVTLLESTRREDQALRYDDIRRSEWFSHIRKPDFQRETNAWTPDDCVEFLDSVVNGRIIPSIILWQSKESSMTYILDGAHRLSVIRAWMIDDWGDKAGEYYDRLDKELIHQAAIKIREMLRAGIGFFNDFEEAWKEHQRLSEQGEAPKRKMSPLRYNQAAFYTQVTLSHHTLAVQWEKGNYESAEQSFLRINRRGQALDPWEATLIEYRKSSYARVVMSIANSGESGHYWPEPTADEVASEELRQLVAGFAPRSADIHQRLFVPPFSSPITSLNVPFMVAPAYFQKHKYLLEVLPLLLNREIAVSEEQQLALMGRDVQSPVNVVIRNADQLIVRVLDSLEHLVSPRRNSTSLSLVPLFYWYNHKGQYARGLFYGFVYWLLSGSQQDVTARKLVFSTNRDRFEHLLFYYKPDIATLQERGGAGLKSTKLTAEFFQAFMSMLSDNRTATTDELSDDFSGILQRYARVKKPGTKSKVSRLFSTNDRSEINVRKLFENAIRCHICGGVMDLQSGLQYDHVKDYAISHETDPETGEPTHPFCNRYKSQITAYRIGEEIIALPSFERSLEKQEMSSFQLSFWGQDTFPE
jgi:hypothetical protein